MIRYFFAVFLITVCIAATASAQQNNNQPIEITAVKSVEWLRDQQKYIARENVIVTQGAMTIHADTVSADYKEGAQSSMEIWQLTAEGNVAIANENTTATGDKAVYNVETGIATLTGQNLKLVSPEQTVTASEKMEYHANTRQAKAIGNAKVVRGRDTLSGDAIIATFKDGSGSGGNGTATPAGTGNLERIEAIGHVVIVTPTETLRGNRALYRADTNTAELTGNVRIERGPNVLEGARAEVNLTTNVSKMFGAANGGGRVRGIFFPGSEDKPAATAPAAPVAPQQSPALPNPSEPVTVAP